MIPRLVDNMMKCLEGEEISEISSVKENEKENPEYHNTLAPANILTFQATRKFYSRNNYNTFIKK